MGSQRAIRRGSCVQRQSARRGRGWDAACGRRNAARLAAGRASGDSSRCDAARIGAKGLVAPRPSSYSFRRPPKIRHGAAWHAGTAANSPTQMKRVAVLGGGPAGSFAAERLASAGLDTVVFDEKMAWEKPCGGGLTFKAYNQYPFLINNDTPKKLITQTVLAAPGAGAVTLKLNEPLLIYSRLDLNRLLLQRAE